MHDNDSDYVPKSQKSAMFKHLNLAERQTKASLARARHAAERRRFEDDLAGIQVMRGRVTREWRTR